MQDWYVRLWVVELGTASDTTVFHLLVISLEISLQYHSLPKDVARSVVSIFQGNYAKFLKNLHSEQVTKLQAKNHHECELLEDIR